MEFQIGDIVVWRYHQSDDVIPHGIIVNIEEFTNITWYSVLWFKNNVISDDLVDDDLKKVS